MFRNQYDTDVTTFSPEGRINQIEHAIKAVEQGSACVGLRSNDFAVLACFKRQASELASHQQKIFEIDEHIGIGTSGLVADARVLSQWCRDECLNHKFVFSSNMPTHRLVKKLSDKSQVLTQTSEARPYGVGILFIGYDKTGPHVYQTIPSGHYFEYVAQGQGSHSQSCRTYLEKHFSTFNECKLGDLIIHAISSLKGAAPDKTLNTQNVSVAYVGKDTKFTHLTGAALEDYMKAVVPEEPEEKKEE